MEDIYLFNLDAETFSKIKEGTKTSQLVITDSKHKKYETGNKITFKTQVEKDDGTSEEKSIDAIIENILYFENLNEAIETLGKEACGYKPSAPLEHISDEFLSTESYDKIEKNGLAALIFKIKEEN